MKIKFCGAVDSVTGSCHLITTDQYKILLDCGQFQGGKTLEARNSEPFPFNPAEIDFMILSHAHVDHCGRIPLLVKEGFKGKIYCTKSTYDLVDVMLRDCGYIHEKDAMWANKKAERTGKPIIEPLYTVEDAEAALPYFVPVLYDQLIKVNDCVDFVFNDAGHILGSAITELWIKEPSISDNISKLVFTGDLGMCNRPILRDPTLIKKADYVIMETTYGNRLHDSDSSSVSQLMDIIKTTYKRGGNIIIPSFAVGRTQELIYELNRFYDGTDEKAKEMQEILNHIDVYIDSPMASSVTQIFKNNANFFDADTRKLILSGDNPLEFRNLKFTKTTADSMALNADDGITKIIISASGMCEAGRIKHHLKHNLWNHKCSVVFVGYQAPGTLGSIIVNGAKEVSIMGERITVGAHIYNLQGFSGHADQDGLLNWLRGFQMKPNSIFLVHGEEDSKHDFADIVKASLDLDCTIIEGVSEYELSKNSVQTSAEDVRNDINEDMLNDIKTKLNEIHDNLEHILYNTNLAVGANITPEQLTAINNAVVQLEGDSINLGSTISK